MSLKERLKVELEELRQKREQERKEKLQKEEEDEVEAIKSKMDAFIKDHEGQIIQGLKQGKRGPSGDSLQYTFDCDLRRWFCAGDKIHTCGTRKYLLNTYNLIMDYEPYGSTFAVDIFYPLE